MEFPVRPDSVLINRCARCSSSTFFPETGVIECRDCEHRYTHAMVEWVETPRYKRFWRMYLDE
ncbi:hypothetical protein DNAM5_17 [Haloarcula californiae tailed virus 1]|uniref:Uncharacterized protein n=1 Tax=Haloarcula californiae tailed virus 1 TaxID=1273746 RepID=R4TAB3_9CAUD|nr:hypothetical protein M202_gp017 [Haloarcula californiae tailed virus 1]AGM11880.1 hypothetical protein DNAM5_17 [Haloarcula californiae tailed virus 1]